LSRERERELNDFSSGKIGLPIGNLTSQIFANIFLDKFDWFIKKQLRIRYYFRYADDFVIIDQRPSYLKGLVGPIGKFLNTDLDLELHPQKMQIRKFRQGIDFLGYVILPHYITLRTKTKRRVFKKINQNLEKLKSGLMSKKSFKQSLQSYCGVLKHCCGYKIKKVINKLVDSRTNNML